MWLHFPNLSDTTCAEKSQAEPTSDNGNPSPPSRAGSRFVIPGAELRV